MEEWKPIPGYEGLYEVSNMGRVKTFNYLHHNGKEAFLKMHKNEKGYLSLELWKDGIGKTYRVHRLVALAFIPNPGGLPQINHLDEDPSNNCVENLEWCDAIYNNNYGNRTDKATKRLSKTVYQYSLSGELIKKWVSTQSVQRQTGFKQSHISMCCIGKRKTAYGYKWSYKMI